MPARGTTAVVNRLAAEDRAAHEWYRFVLSYPPHLVRDYLERFGLGPESCVLDPFSGTGTTVVECKKHGVPSLGLEAHPLAHFAASTKVNWSVSAAVLAAAAEQVSEAALRQLRHDGVPDDPQRFLAGEGPAEFALRSLPAEQLDLLLENSISPLPLHKVLVLRDAIAAHAKPAVQPYLQLALAKALVGPVGNLHFGPEVGVGPLKDDAAVVSSWHENVLAMADDLRLLRPRRAVRAVVHHADARNAAHFLPPASIDAVITSPPYPNEKDYTRTTRLESVLLGLVTTKKELQNLKRTMLLRSNTRGVYKGDGDDAWVAGHAEIQRIATAIEDRRIALGKTSGFERLYARVTKLYFGGMARHLAELRPALRPGAHLAYVVGDQASYLRVMIRTGQLLASLAEELGYEVVGLDLFRTRLATATKEQLREEVLLLRWPG
ncbi:MAG: DNA methyltransferase [Opitutae bacterium]|nr:DNA methyltransferase [Opitutae bacterium]